MWIKWVAVVVKPSQYQRSSFHIPFNRDHILFVYVIYPSSPSCPNFVRTLLIFVSWMFTFTICFSHLFLGVINSLDNFYDRRPACSLFAYFPKLAPNCLLFTILTTKGRYNGTVRSHNRRFPCCSSSGMTALCSLGLHSGCASTVRTHNRRSPCWCDIRLELLIVTS